MSTHYVVVRAGQYLVSYTFGSVEWSNEERDATLFSRFDADIRAQFLNGTVKRLQVTVTDVGLHWEGGPDAYLLFDGDEIVAEVWDDEPGWVWAFTVGMESVKFPGPDEAKAAAVKAVKDSWAKETWV